MNGRPPAVAKEQIAAAHQHLTGMIRRGVICC
jgi:hypothetical protein